MKRWTALLLVCMLCLTGIRVPVTFAEQHPITLSVSVDPDCELEQAGEIGYLLFTLHNSSDEAFTLHNAKLSGGYENVIYPLDSTVTILGGGTKEFTLYQVNITEEQFDVPVTYTLEFEEHRTDTDEFGVPAEETVSHTIRADVTLVRYVPPQLTLSVASDAELVRNGENFTVTYTISNDTKFDMSSLVLTDLGQGGALIPLPLDTLIAGESFSLPVNYTMGETDMEFTPCVSYVARQRATETRLYAPLTVQSCVVALDIQVVQYPTTSEGTTFALTVTNSGNRSVTSIQILDEIHSKVGEPFDLAPDQQHVLMYTVSSAADSNVTRNVHFHGSGTDIFGEVFTFSDDQTFIAQPYISSDAVRISLSVLLTEAYINEQGDLIGKIRFTLSNHSDVTITDATLLELESLGMIEQYAELHRGDTYYADEFCLNGLDKLSFRLDVFDRQGKPYASDVIVLDISNLESLASQKEEETVIYRSNAFLEELVSRVTDFLTVAGIVLGCVALFCMIACGILYYYEHRVRSMLPQHKPVSSKERSVQLQPVESALFHSPAEQFGYQAPAKLRNYAVSSTNPPEVAIPREATLRSPSNDSDQTAVPVLTATAITERRKDPVIPVENPSSPDETRVIPVPGNSVRSSADRTDRSRRDLSSADPAERVDPQIASHVPRRNDADPVIASADGSAQELHQGSPRRLKSEFLPERREAKDTTRIIRMP